MPINILIFEPYPFNSEGGNQKTQSYILDLVDRKIFNLILLAPFETKFIDRIRKKGIECVVVKPPERVLQYGGKALQDSIIGRLMTMAYMVKYNLQLIKVIRNKRIDVIYSNCIRAVLSIGLAAKLCRIPHLWYIKGELANTILDPVGFFLADKILFFCESNKNDKYPWLVKKYDKKVGILRIGMDLDHIVAIEKKNKAHLRKELSIDNKKVNIIYLGQLYAPKGVHYLLEAIRLIIKEFPGVRLYIVGDHGIDEYKSYKEELVNIIKKNKMEDKVTFTGWRSDALEIVSLMDILVHPSLAEGFGRAVLEAMALGRAVVASKVGGLRELIKDGENGFLVEPKSSEQIAKKLSILMKDKNLRDKFGQAARATVFAEYSIEDKIRQLESVWKGMALES